MDPPGLVGVGKVRALNAISGAGWNRTSARRAHLTRYPAERLPDRADLPLSGALPLSYRSADGFLLGASGWSEEATSLEDPHLDCHAHHYEKGIVVPSLGATVVGRLGPDCHGEDREHHQLGPSVIHQCFLFRLRSSRIAGRIKLFEVKIGPPVRLHVLASGTADQNALGVAVLPVAIDSPLKCLLCENRGSAYLLFTLVVSEIMAANRQHCASHLQ